MGAEPTEIEVKLGVDDPGPIRALIRHPDPAVLAGFGPARAIERRVVVDRYLDTAPVGGVLALAGYRARLRIAGRRTTLTLKGESRYEGLVTERLEIEGPASRRVSPDHWPPSAARDRLLAILGRADGPSHHRRLVEIASLRQHRLVRLVRRGNDEVELSLDELEAPAARPEAIRARRTELEAELHAGDRAALAELAAALERLPGLRAPEGSKRDFAIAASRPEGEPESPIDNTRLI